MGTMEIRTAELADWPELQAVYRRSSLSNDGDRPHLLAHPEVLDLPEGPVREGRSTLATMDGQVAGFATVDPAGAVVELTALFVDPGFMRRGVGRALMGAVVAEAQRGGHGRIEATTNTHASEFYEQVGFVAGGRVETRFDDGVRMHLDVAPPG